MNLNLKQDDILMKCLKCSKNASIKHSNGYFCHGCFIAMLSNRIKKEVRTECPFDKNEKILVFGKLAKFFLEKTVEDLPIKIIESRKEKDFSSYDKVVIPWTADDEANLFYSELTKDKINLEKIGHNKVIKIFKPVLDKELTQAAKILKIGFKINPKNKELEKIHEKYPSSKFGLVRTAQEFKKAMR